jgi:hypothetical protein
MQRGFFERELYGQSYELDGRGHCAALLNLYVTHYVMHYVTYCVSLRVVHCVFDSACRYPVNDPSRCG